MNIVQTLHIPSGVDPFLNSFGWVAPEFHLMSWALSCLQLCKLYPKVDLYANSSAAQLLIDTLQLPYSNVYLSHDQLTLADPRLWALPKIHTYSLQQAPFLHVDGDVFIFDKFRDSLLAGALIAQNTEEATEYYRSTQQELTTHFTYFPACVKADFDSGIPIRAANAGILGGNDVGFLNDYARQACTYINRNVGQLRHINVDRFNVFFEQHLFYSLAQEQNRPISFLFDDVINDNEYKYLGDFHEVPATKSYLHLLGHFKKDAYTCIQMAMRLRDLYPEYYYRIADLFRQKKLPFFIDYSAHEPLSAARHYRSFQARACRHYHAATPGPRLAAHSAGAAAATSGSLASFAAIAQAAMQEMQDISLKTAISADYSRFVQDLGAYSEGLAHVSFDFLYGRDLEAVGWHNKLFAPAAVGRTQSLVRCPETSVIVSGFDWSRLVNSHKRVGVQHYLTTELTQGHYFNLLVPEVYQDGLSFFDIDELEKTILDHATAPISLDALLETMRSYADDEVREHHQALFDNFILTLVKQLVVKKAIKPIEQTV